MESDTSAGGSDGHRGELSLLEFMQTMLPSLEADAPSAAMAIRLSEEQHRRQECEKLVEQLQARLATLQQDQAVARAALQRKDSLLSQAQQQWTRLQLEAQQKLATVVDERDRLSSELTRLGERVQSALQDVEAARREASEAVARYDRAAGALEEQLSENRLLKEAGEKQRDQCHQAQERQRELTAQKDDATQRAEELQLQNHRLKNTVEDLKREKESLRVELELFQERYDSNRQQWELHCRARVEGTMNLAQEEADRRLKLWQTEVESRLRHLVATLQQQLGLLKQKSVEESNAMAQRHEDEMRTVRSRCVQLQQQVEQHQKEQAELTQQMRQLVEAQWNTVNRLGNPSPVVVAPRYVVTTPAPKYASSDTTSASRASSLSVGRSSHAKRSDIHRYVTQVLERQNCSGENQPTTAAAGQRRKL